MANSALKQWYITGLHAYRSASEQSNKAATEAERTFNNPDLKKLAGEGAALGARQQETLAAFLKELDATPNDYLDRIQDGVNKGTEMAVKAAPDDGARDVALQFGSRAAVTYFIMAFDNHAIYAKALGLTGQAETFERLSAENKALDERYARAGKTVLSKIAA